MQNTDQNRAEIYHQQITTIAFVTKQSKLRVLTLPSARAEMTFPRDDRDLLMFLASSSTAPSAPVLLT